MKLTPEQQRKLRLLELRQQYRKRLRFAFDPSDLSSRPTPAQLKIMKSKHNIHYIVASNRAGKSQFGARQLSWWFEGNHPYLERPKKWGDGPITLLLVGRVGEQMDSELWANKVERFLEPGSYKVVKSGNAISRVEHLKNGNKIIFISHHDADTARQKAQAYTAQVVWLDEMPTKVGILNELRMRVLDSDGYMYCTFTPLLRNMEIAKIVDTPSKRAKKWFLSIFDNPKLKDKTKAEIIEEYRAMSASEAELNARLYGKWMSADTAVFTYDSERNWAKPLGYDPAVWPHIAIVDPAASGLAGLVVMARRPQEDVWHCVMAKYIKGDAFSRMVPEIEGMISKFNIVDRFCDNNPSSFYREAKILGIKYRPIEDKPNSKEDMIDETNSALAREIVYLGPGAELLADELSMCQRAEDNPNRIIKASKYHTADAFRYFIRMKPKFTAFKAEPKPEERIRRAWKDKLTKDAKRDKIKATTQFKQMKRQQRMFRRQWGA